MVVMKMVLMEELHRQVNIITPALLFISLFTWVLVQKDWERWESESIGN